MALFLNENFDDHESVHFFSDVHTGLKAILAIHNTNLGPSAGGTRFWAYETEDSALNDVLRLSKAMSYKNAMAGIPFGGGKAVILRPQKPFDRVALFEAYGRAINSLGGRYNTAEDVGVSPEDMKVVRSQTSYVAGLDEGVSASGDPSPVTAEGVFRGLKVAAKHVWGSSDLSARRVAIQGLGHVGYNLAARLYRAGAQLIVTDINTDAVMRAVAEFGAKAVLPDEIYNVDADIFVPCALGGAINSETIDVLRVKIVGGAANNQLSDTQMGAQLQKRDILYCPDYVINGGGIINVAAELSGQYDPDWVEAKIDGLGQTLNTIFTQSETSGMPTNETADLMAKEKIYGHAA